MPTVSVPLSTTTYVKVNQGKNPITLQVHRDAVRIAFSDVQPASTNEVFHILSEKDGPKDFNFQDTDIWALATTDTTSLIATEFQHATTPPTKDSSFRTAFNTIFGEQAVSERIDDVSVNFHYGASTRHDVNDLSTGTGSIAEVGSDVRVSSGTGVGTGWLQSQDSIRYRAGHEAFSFFTFDMTEGEAGVNYYIGPLNDSDGFAFGRQGAEFGIWFVEDDTAQFIPQSSFNVDTIDWIDPTQRQLACISYGYLGIAPPVFRVYGGISRGWITAHIIDLVGQQAEGHVKNPTLPISMKVERTTGSGNNHQITTGSWNAGSYGGGSVADRWAVVTATQVNIPAHAAGVYSNMFTLRNVDVFNGKSNHVRAELAVVNFTTDTNKSVEFANIVNGTLAGNTTFTDVSPGESVLQVSYEGTVTGAAAGAATTLSKTSDRRTDVRGTDLYIYPGGADVSLGVRGVGGSAVTGDIVAAFRIIQEF